MKVEVTSANRGGTVFCAETRGHQMICDVPPPWGGTDTGMTGGEALLAALGNCLGTVIALACQNKGLPYEGLTVEVEADLDKDNFILRDLRATVHMPGPMSDMTRRTVEAAQHMCVVHNTLGAGAHATIVVAE